MFKFGRFRCDLPEYQLKNEINPSFYRDIKINALLHERRARNKTIFYIHCYYVHHLKSIKDIITPLNYNENDVKMLYIIFM